MSDETLKDQADAFFRELDALVASLDLDVRVVAVVGLALAAKGSRLVGVTREEFLDDAGRMFDAQLGCSNPECARRRILDVFEELAR